MIAKAKHNAFKDAIGVLGAGVDALFDGIGKTEEDFDFVVNLDDIDIEPQFRKIFEDAESTLLELGESLLEGQIHEITVRQNRADHVRPYLLVSGERRVRAARLVNLPTLRARFRVLDDEQARRVQQAENIHTKNIEQLEAAYAIQEFLDEGKDKKGKRTRTVADYVAKFHKSPSWVSKRLALLDLPEYTQQILTKNISDDLEVIGAVKAIEKINPQRAEALVIELTEKKGKVNTRDKVFAVKEEVKPSKKVEPVTPADSFFSGAKMSDSLSSLLAKVYLDVCNLSINPRIVLNTMEEDDKTQIEAWLRSFFDLGKQDKLTSRTVIKGFRHDLFSSSGVGALSLVAYLRGVDHKDNFSLMNILKDIQP
jgi:ParB family chromosome partitioning protein